MLLLLLASFRHGKTNKNTFLFFLPAFPVHSVLPDLHLTSAQVKGGNCLRTCSLRPTGIYGEGHELIRDFYDLAMQRGGVVMGGVPDKIEHGRVYAGERMNLSLRA